MELYFSYNLKALVLRYGVLMCNVNKYTMQWLDESGENCNLVLGIVVLFLYPPFAYFISNVQPVLQ